MKRVWRIVSAVLLVLAVLALIAVLHLALPVMLCLAAFPYACALLWHGVQIISPVHFPIHYPFPGPWH